MFGGLGHRKFYVNEIDRLESEHREKLPGSKYTNEEIQAGFDRLANAFGFYGTLLYMEKETGFKRKELENWTVYEFNANIQYLAWQAKAIKDYHDIMTKKK